MSYGFEITIDNLNSNQPVFRFVKPLLVPPRWTKATINLNSFAIYAKRSGAWDYKHPLWGIGLEFGSYLKIQEISYGIVPEGFTETIKAQPLLFEETYQVNGTAAGGYGDGEFILSGPSDR